MEGAEDGATLGPPCMQARLAVRPLLLALADG